MPHGMGAERRHHDGIDEVQGDVVRRAEWRTVLEGTITGRPSR